MQSIVECTPSVTSSATWKWRHSHFHGFLVSKNGVTQIISLWYSHCLLDIVSGPLLAQARRSRRSRGEDNGDYVVALRELDAGEHRARLSAVAVGEKVRLSSIGNCFFTTSSNSRRLAKKWRKCDIHKTLMSHLGRLWFFFCFSPKSHEAVPNKMPLCSASSRMPVFSSRKGTVNRKHDMVDLLMELRVDCHEKRARARAFATRSFVYTRTTRIIESMPRLVTRLFV